MKTSEKLKEAYSELIKYNSPATQLILEAINEVVEMEEEYIKQKINHKDPVKRWYKKPTNELKD
jgi:hypothetical protein